MHLDHFPEPPRIKCNDVFDALQQAIDGCSPRDIDTRHMLRGVLAFSPTLSPGKVDFWSVFNDMFVRSPSGLHHLIEDAMIDAGVARDTSLSFEEFASILGNLRMHVHQLIHKEGVALKLHEPRLSSGRSSDIAILENYAVQCGAFDVLPSSDADQLEFFSRPVDSYDVAVTPAYVRLQSAMCAEAYNVLRVLEERYADFIASPGYVVNYAAHCFSQDSSFQQRPVRRWYYQFKEMVWEVQKKETRKVDVVQLVAKLGSCLRMNHLCGRKFGLEESVNLTAAEKLEDLCRIISLVIRELPSSGIDASTVARCALWAYQDAAVYNHVFTSRSSSADNASFGQDFRSALRDLNVFVGQLAQQD